MIKDEQEINDAIAEELEKLLKAFGDTPETRLKIANYTFGYLGMSYSLHPS